MKSWARSEKFGRADYSTAIRIAPSEGRKHFAPQGNPVSAQDLRSTDHFEYALGSVAGVRRPPHAALAIGSLTSSLFLAASSLFFSLLALATGVASCGFFAGLPYCSS